MMKSKIFFVILHVKYKLRYGKKEIIKSNR